MALTSTQGWRRRLRQNWQRLHRLIYLVAPLAVIHLLWLSKDGTLTEVIYLLVLLLLLAERAMFTWQKRNAGH